MTYNLGSIMPYKKHDIVNRNFIYPNLPASFFFDQTHDNKSYFRAGALFQTLPVAAVLAFSHINNATTKGFDELY